MSFTEEPAPAVSQSGQTQTIDSVAERPDRDATAETPERDATAESPERHATAETPDWAPSDGQLRPGDTADDPVAALWGADLVEHFRGRWQELQLAFVDDPHAATQQAAQLVDEAVESLTSALTTQKQSLDGWQRQERGDTEELRNALQRYRGFLDRLLGM